MELALWLAQGSREAVVCLYPLTSQTVCIPQHIYIPNYYWFLSFYFRSTVRFASPLPLLHIFVCMSPPLSAKRGEAETKKARWGTEGREGRSIIGVEQSEKQRWRREQCLRLRLDGIATERTNFGRSFFFFFLKGSVTVDCTIEQQDQEPLSCLFFFCNFVKDSFRPWKQVRTEASSARYAMAAESKQGSTKAAGWQGAKTGLWPCSASSGKSNLLITSGRSNNWTEQR